MSNLLRYGIGLDLSKEKFDASIGVINGKQEIDFIGFNCFPNSSKGYQQYLSWVKQICKEAIPVIHLMEATGVYYESLALNLYQQGCFTSVILPNKAKKYMQSLGLRSKNDRIDSKGLCRMACEQKLPQWKPMSKELYQLRIITRQIESIAVKVTVLANELEALSNAMYQDKEVERMIKQNIKMYEKQKQKLLERIEFLVDSNEELKSRIANILRIKGLGLLAIVTILAETGGFELFFSSGQLVSYAGYDVIENQSGNHKGKTKISKQGNGRIRRCLHFPSLNMVRYNIDPFAALYHRIYSRSNIKMKAYTAVQKKLLIIIYTLWKRHEPFQYKTSGEKEPMLSFVSVPQEQ